MLRVSHLQARTRLMRTQALDAGLPSIVTLKPMGEKCVLEVDVGHHLV